MTDIDAVLYADEAETSLLGCLLVHPGTWTSIAGYVRKEDFYSPVHGRLFAAIALSRESGGIPTAVTLAPQFELDEDMAALGGSRAYIANLCSFAFSPSSASEYARHIRDVASRREFFNLMRDAQDKSVQFSTPLTEIVASTVSAASRIDNGEVGSMSQSEVFGSVLDEIGTPRPCDSTGIEALDHAMQGGLYRGWTYGFAAHEKVGKTTLAHSISYNLNMAGVRHTYIALEMGKEQLSQRQLARRAGINSLAFLQPHGDTRFLNRMREVAASIPDNVQYLNLYQADFDTLKARLSREVLRENIAGFILDYWQLVGGVRKGQSEEAHLREVSQWIASFCREHRVWSIVIAQLNDNEKTFGGSGLTKACDQLYKLYRCTSVGCENHAWLEMAVTRYTPKTDVGSDISPSLIMRKDIGPYFTDFFDQGSGEVR